MRERREKLILHGRKNIAGENIRKIRLSLENCSQEMLAEKLQLAGLSVHKNMIQQIESGKQCITDIELKFFAQVLNVSISNLMDESVFGESVQYDETPTDYGVQKVAQRPT